MPIAMMAGEGQVVIIIAPSVLPGHYVLDVMGNLQTFFRKLTVFTAMVRSAPHQISDETIHPGAVNPDCGLTGTGFEPSISEW